jgi:Photosynthesis system II assembly factor YCF48
MPSDDRDRNFENALASHLRPGSSSPASNTCADPETLAAYHERSLAPDQMASLKTHVTDCERCQQILAHLEATDEIPVAAPNTERQAAAAAKSGVHVLHARRPTLWRWVAPAGALAAALLVWVAVHENSSVRVPTQPPRVDVKGAETVNALPAPPPPLTQPPSLDATRKSAATASDALEALNTPPPSKGPGALQPRRRALLKEKDSLRAAKRSSAADDSNQLADNSLNRRPPSASEEDLKSLSPGVATETVTVEAAKTEAARTEAEEKAANDKRDAASPRSPQPAPAPAIAGAAPAAPPAQSTARPQVPTGMSRFDQKADMRLANSIGEVTISAPGGRVSWRIGQAGVIEFSSDAGKTWTLQPSGVITDLLAGSAPSDKVCWIVGRSGTVLRTTDGGAHWQKVRPPIQEDLRSVFAVDARQATVSPTNGTYQTTNGGASWNKFAPE